MTIPVVTEGEGQQLTGNKGLDILRGIFHLEEFRGCQQEAIESIASGRNTVLIMPTGGGKTICYAVPALMEPKVTIVIFPLLALLLDQVERMRAKGLSVCYLMSDMDETEKECIIHQLHSKPPVYNFLFATPETVLSGTVFELVVKLINEDLINFFVIDEAHCIDTWGFHFRPSYSELWKLTELDRPILAMTGTATQRTQETIVSNLKLSSETKVIRQTSDRSNLLFHVLDKKSDGKDALVELIRKEYPEQCGIVYCVERSDTVDVAYRLKTAGVNAVFFHAGMDVCAKQQSVESWKNGGAHVMCATIAFGMGIDKPNVRFVIHHSVPKDLESYVQESGRAGRDGQDAHCYIFFRFEDRTKHLRNISTLPENERKIICLNGLNDIVQYCISPVCRRKQIVAYFDGEANPPACNRSCDICSGGRNVEPTDKSEDAIKIVNCLESMQQIHPKVTTKLLVLTFRGSKANNVITKGFSNLREYGMGKEKFSEKQLLKFVQFLIIDNILVEQLPPANEKSTTPYIVKGNNATKLINKELCFYFFNQ